MSFPQHNTFRLGIGILMIAFILSQTIAAVVLTMTFGDANNAQRLRCDYSLRSIRSRRDA